MGLPHHQALADGKREDEGHVRVPKARRNHQGSWLEESAVNDIVAGLIPKYFREIELIEAQD